MLSDFFGDGSFLVILNEGKLGLLIKGLIDIAKRDVDDSLSSFHVKNGPVVPSRWFEFRIKREVKFEIVTALKALTDN